MVNPQSPAHKADRFRLIEVAGDLTHGIARDGSTRPIATFGLRADALAFLDYLEDLPECAECHQPIREMEGVDKTGTMHYEPCAGAFAGRMADNAYDAWRDAQIDNEAMDAEERAS